MIKIAINQMNSTIADFDGNTAIMIDAMRLAAKNNASLLVFPELSVCGYYPYDLVYESFFIAQSDKAVLNLLEASSKFPFTHYYYRYSPKKYRNRKPFYNALIVIKYGKIISEYCKQLLPTYNVFDERGHFEPGPALPCSIEVCETKIGLLICEDAWNDTKKHILKTLKGVSGTKP